MAYRAYQGLLSLSFVLSLAACGDKPSTELPTETFDETAVRPDSVPARIDYTQPTAPLRAKLAKGTCTEWKQRGDSLHTLFTGVTELLERMRSSMEHGPLDDLIVADSVYRANGDGERLYKDLRGFYALALRSAADKDALKRTEGMAMQVVTFPSADAWRRACFVRVPRVTSSTILSKIATDALLVESICLHSILKECERSVGGSPFPESDSTGE